MANDDSWVENLTKDDNDSDDAFEEKKKANHQKYVQNLERKIRRFEVVKISENLRIAADNLKTSITNLTGLKEDKVNLYGVDPERVEKDKVVSNVTSLKFLDSYGFKSLDDLKNLNYDYTISKKQDWNWRHQKKAMAHYGVFNYLKDLSSITMEKSKIKSEADALNYNNWNEFVKSLNLLDDGFLSSTVKPVASFLNEYFNPFNGFIDDQAQWANGFEGKILLSDSANRTASFDDGQTLTYTKNRDYFEENLKELKIVLDCF